MSPGKTFVAQLNWPATVILVKVLPVSHLFVKAEDEAKRLCDDYVSVGHLALALLDADASTPLGRILKKFDIGRDGFLRALVDACGNQRVTSPDPEGTYDALRKYGVDLVDQVRRGKLDRVIGRDAEIRRVVRILSRKSA